MNTTQHENQNIQDYDEDVKPVSFEGNLKVTYVNGRFGSFPVGTLFTDVGNFTVRDAWLETLTEGEYSGIFNVSKLSLYSYQAFGELRTSIKATIETYHLDDYSDDSNSFEEEMPDPIESELAKEELKNFSRDNTFRQDEENLSTNNQIDDKTIEASVNLLLSHFSGDKWELGDDYRIDSTLSRADIIQCKQALQLLGYHFEPKLQLWRGY